MTTEEEMLKILTPLVLNFTESSLPVEQQHQRLLLFAHELSDLPAEVLMLAVKKIINEPRTFFPRIGEIRDVAVALTEPVYPSALEAWDMVTGGDKSCELANRVFRTLKIDRGNLRFMDFSDVGVARSHFVREYKGKVEIEKEIVRMPPAVRELRQQAIAHAGQRQQEERHQARISHGSQKISDLLAEIMKERAESAQN